MLYLISQHLSTSHAVLIDLCNALAESAAMFELFSRLCVATISAPVYVGGVARGDRYGVDRTWHLGGWRGGGIASQLCCHWAGVVKWVRAIDSSGPGAMAVGVGAMAVGLDAAAIAVAYTTCTCRLKNTRCGNPTCVCMFVRMERRAG